VVWVTVVGGSGPGPSGSTTVVGAEGSVVGDVGVVGGVDVVVGVVVVGLGVVVVVVVLGVVVRGRSCTFVRGTHVYSGSGTKPGGTIAVSGAAGGAGGSG
jgi:hypothetical protein